MRIGLASVYVSDQDKALDFYTRVLGFVPKTEIPMGDFRWLTVVSPDGPGETELVLEPAHHPAVQAFTSTLRADGIPFTSFLVEDVAAEHARLVGLGVTFVHPPTLMEGVTYAVLDDTCGNLIQIADART